MSRKQRRDSAEWAWEQALIDDYHDYRWREALAPLVRAVHRWEEGKADPEDVANAAEGLRKPVETLDWVFSQKRDYLVRMILFHEDWSRPWLATHPRPVPASALSASPDEGTSEPELGGQTWHEE
jgi:hypothetical protein